MTNHTLLKRCIKALSTRSSLEEKVAAMAVANRLVVRVMLEDSTATAQTSANDLFKLFAKIFVTNATLVTRMLATHSLRDTPLSLIKCCTNYLTSFESSDAAETETTDKLWLAMAALIHSLASLLTTCNDPETSLQIIDIYTHLAAASSSPSTSCSHKTALLALCDEKVFLAVTNSIAKSSATCLQQDSELPEFTFLNHLFASLHTTLTTATTTPTTTMSQSQSESIQILASKLSTLFHETDSTHMPLKLAYARHLLPALLVLPLLPSREDHHLTEMSKTLLPALAHLLQNKLPSQTSTLLLHVANAAAEALGPLVWTRFAVSAEHQKFFVLLVHLSAAELRVALDGNSGDAGSSIRVDGSGGSNGEVEVDAGVVVARVRFLGIAVETLVSSGDSDGAGISGELLQSAQRSLAEAYVAVLAWLVELRETRMLSSKDKGDKRQETEETAMESACMESVCKWLVEDTAAMSVAEVVAAMPVFVEYASTQETVGLGDLGGVFVNITAEDEGSVRERFLECGGGNVVAGWVLRADIESDSQIERQRIGVTCLLNLVVGLGARVLGRVVEGCSSVNEVSRRLVVRVLETELRKIDGESTAPVHTLNACCLVLFLVNENVEGMESHIRNEVAARTMTHLYAARLLQNRCPEEWDEVSELWLLSVRALATITRKEPEVARVFTSSDDFVKLAQLCGEYAQRNDVDMEFDHASSVQLFQAVQSVQ